MLYLNSEDISVMGCNWEKKIRLIEDSAALLDSELVDQPIKPYLSFAQKQNRIIAMPARIDGELPSAGIKWIASFPDNHVIDKPRAHSITILNSPNTGEPLALISGAIISAIRTASVSGLMIKKFMEARKSKKINLGIIGFGQIGKMHLKMAKALLKDDLEKVKIYDVKQIDEKSIPEDIVDKTTVSTSWEDVYETSDIFITCTVSNNGYIDKKPKTGSLILNVSLRDFKSDILNFSPVTVVDKWEEVCRANTDIERMSNEKNLSKNDTYSLIDIVRSDVLKTISEDKAIMFHPMGMATFDIVIAEMYYRKALEKNSIGVKLTI